MACLNNSATGQELRPAVSNEQALCLLPMVSGLARGHFLQEHNGEADVVRPLDALLCFPRSEGLVVSQSVMGGGVSCKQKWHFCS